MAPCVVPTTQETGHRRELLPPCRGLEEEGPRLACPADGRVTAQGKRYVKQILKEIVPGVCSCVTIRLSPTASKHPPYLAHDSVGQQPRKSSTRWLTSGPGGAG